MIDENSLCEECGEVKALAQHLVGTMFQPRDFYGCEECAAEQRDGTV